MSMISAQCDELRELALWLDDEFYDAEATKVRDAADTILSLRDMAQGLQAENAKLRGFWTHDGTWHVELPRLPEGIAVTTPDERDREVRTAMVWRYEPARTARRVIVSNADTDHATGHCECGACGGAIDPWDAYCRHCGARMEEDA